MSLQELAGLLMVPGVEVGGSVSVDMVRLLSVVSVFDNDVGVGECDTVSVDSVDMVVVISWLGTEVGDCNAVSLKKANFNNYCIVVHL